MEMNYVQEAPLSRSATSLYDFAVKHFVRIPVSGPVPVSMSAEVSKNWRFQEAGHPGRKEGRPRCPAPAPGRREQ